MHSNMKKAPGIFTLATIFLTSFLFAIQHASASPKCGNVFDAQYGVHDYNDPKFRTPSGRAISTLKTVERRHFTSKVERLISGESTKSILADIDYTLRKFPNHHRALFSLIKYDKSLNGKLPRGSQDYEQSVQCYFKRALDFRPEDGKTLQLFGMYYHLNGKYEKAIQVYSKANEHLPSPELHYNMGLAYFHVKKYEKSKEFAQKAYESNYPLMGLRDKLARVGVELNI